MPSDPKRRDPRRKQKKAVESVDSGEDICGEDQVYSQPRASHHAKKPQKPPNGNIIINGDVHIKNLKDFNLIQGRRDEQRQQRSSTPVRNSTRRLQPNWATTRSTAKCSPSASEEDATTQSDESEPENDAPKRPAKIICLPERPRLYSEKKKREQADEGYHTSGTVSAYTAQVPAKEQGKGKERSISSADSSSSRARQSSWSRESRERESETDATSCHSEENNRDEMSAEEDGPIEQNGHLEDEEASDDDFGKLPIHIGNPNNLDASAIGEKAILDTGTKVDWISQIFYDKLRDIGVHLTKLSPTELELQYRDFQGKKFQPTCKVELMIQTDEFKGQIKCRLMPFFVASKATFAILFGRDTIRKHAFLTRSKFDTDGEGVLIGVHDEMTEAKKADVKKKKEEQKKVSQERKKTRDSKTEKVARQKDNVSSSSSKVAAHLATSVSRGSKTRPPPKDSPGKLSSSMEGTW